MSTNIRSLKCPESLSDSVLLENVKTRCIELPNDEKLKKSELIKMYYSLVLPLPQRQYNETKSIGKMLSKLRCLRKIPVDIGSDKKLYESIISSQSKSSDVSDLKRSRQSCLDENEDSNPKKLQLTNSSAGTNGISENNLKRTINDKEVSAQSGVKKRQKIMWP